MMIPDRSQPLAAVAPARDRRVKLGVGEIGQRGLDGGQVGVRPLQTDCYRSVSTNQQSSSNQTAACALAPLRTRSRGYLPRW